MVNYPEIKRRREALTLTFDEAATRANRIELDTGGEPTWTRQRWYDVESGRFADPRISTLQVVAVVLGCSVTELLLPLGEGARPARKGRKPTPSTSKATK